MEIFIINLPTANARRKFQQDQLSRLSLEYKIIEATSVDEITTNIYEKHYFDWQRPLLKNEIACYLSHRSAWNRVIKNKEPALILEDDALLSNCVPSIIDNLINITDIDLVNLENRGRKKFVSKSSVDIECKSKLVRLYQDRTGAAGYILWPSGAKKLIQLEKNNGIALADAHITSCYKLKAYQIEPSPIIQLDQCNLYGIENTYSGEASISTVGSNDKSRAGINFIAKRLINQFSLGIRQLSLLTKSTRRFIKIRKNDFYY